MNLILLRPYEVDGTNAAVLSAQDRRSKHILGHLKKTNGQTVIVGVVDGKKYRATVVEVGDGTLKLVLGEEIPTEQPIPQITLVLAVPFPRRLKYMWPVAASLGISHIIVVRGCLSDQQHLQSSCLQPQVYESLIEDGMSQGGHTKQVRVDLAVTEIVSRGVLEKHLGCVEGTSINNNREDTEQKTHAITAKIFLDCGDEETVPPPVRDVVLKQCCGTSSCSSNSDDSAAATAIVAVGPERGWTDDEARLFADAGFEAATLGPSILRVDTATVAGVSLVMAALNEVGCRQRESNGNSNKRKFGD